MGWLSVRVDTADGVDLVAWQKAFMEALANTPGVRGVEVESGEEATETLEASPDTPALEEASRFYVRTVGGSRVAVAQQQFFILRALTRVGVVRSGKRLAELVGLDGVVASAPSLAAAYSKLLDVMDQAGYPLIRRRGVYGFKACEAGHKNGGRGSLRRRKLEEEA